MSRATRNSLSLADGRWEKSKVRSQRTQSKDPAIKICTTTIFFNKAFCVSAGVDRDHRTFVYDLHIMHESSKNLTSFVLTKNPQGEYNSTASVHMQLPIYLKRILKVYGLRIIQTELVRIFPTENRAGQQWVFQVGTRTIEKFAEPGISKE